jgi:iron complex transport system substrate-binding protein
MEDAGLKVVALKNGSIEDLWSWISILGSIFQKTDRANWLIDYFKDSVDEISTQVEEISDADKPSALVLYDDLKVSTLAGAQAYWLENSGAKNLIDGFASGSSSIDMEQVLTWNPDVIYISNFTTLNPSDLIQNTLSGEDWSPVKAVQSGSVYKIPIGGYRWDPPSVETPLMVRWLAKIQHPDLFSSMDMGNELKKFYQDVYDYDMSDDMVSQVLDHTQE